MELGRKQCRIRTPNAEHDKYPRIAQHGRTDVLHDLVGKLMTEAAPDTHCQTCGFNQRAWFGFS